MDTKVAAVAPSSDPGLKSISSPVQSPVDKAPAKQGPDPNDLRLVIEMNQETGSYVYKTVDRFTGEVLQELPRADVLKMRSGDSYATGSLVNTAV